MVLQFVTPICFSLLLELCQTNFQVFIGIFTGFMAATYIAYQAILLYMTVLRLQVVAKANAAQRARHLFHATLLLGGLASVTIGLSIATRYGFELMGFLMNFLAIGFIAVGLLLYVLCQCYALYIFIGIAREAQQEIQCATANASATDLQRGATKRASATAVALAASAGTTVLYIMAVVAWSVSGFRATVAFK